MPLIIKKRKVSIHTEHNGDDARHRDDLPVGDVGADDRDVGDAEGQAERQEAAEEAPAVARGDFGDVHVR